MEKFPLSKLPAVQKFDVNRLEILASVLRHARAAHLGHNIELADLREKRRDIRAQAGLVALNARDRGFSTASVGPELDRLDGQIEKLASQIAEVEAIQASKLADAYSARANLEAAVAFADANNLPFRADIRELLN